MNQNIYSPEVEAQRAHYERLAEIMSVLSAKKRRDEKSAISGQNHDKNQIVLAATELEKGKKCLLALAS